MCTSHQPIEGADSAPRLHYHAVQDRRSYLTGERVKGEHLGPPAAELTIEQARALVNDKAARLRQGGYHLAGEGTDWIIALDPGAASYNLAVETCTERHR